MCNRVSRPPWPLQQRYYGRWKGACWATAYAGFVNETSEEVVCSVLKHIVTVQKHYCVRSMRCNSGYDSYLHFFQRSLTTYLYAVPMTKMLTRAQYDWTHVTHAGLPVTVTRTNRVCGLWKPYTSDNTPQTCGLHVLLGLMFGFRVTLDIETKAVTGCMCRIIDRTIFDTFRIHISFRNNYHITSISSSPSFHS